MATTGRAGSGCASGVTSDHSGRRVYGTYAVSSSEEEPDASADASGGGHGEARSTVGEDDDERARPRAVDFLVKNP